LFLRWLVRLTYSADPNSGSTPQTRLAKDSCCGEAHRLSPMTLPPIDLPPAASPAFQDLTEEQKLAFAAEYGRRKRSLAVMMVLAILFPIQLFFLGRIGLAVLFLLTGGGLGIWYVIEWFLTPGRVRDYNTGIASEIVLRYQTG